jgi:hypothetical protein
VDERDTGQSRAAESRPQLEPLLKRLLVFLVRCVFDDNSVVTFADFAALLGLAFCNTPCFCSVVFCANDHLNTSLTTLEES